MLQIAILVVLLVNFKHAHPVCYPPYGCFGGEAPFNQALVQLPERPSIIGTSFLYYTRNNSLNPELIDPLASKLPSRVKFDPSKFTVMFTHGYIESRNVWYVQRLVDELLNHDDMNVIFCEWSKGSAFPYQQAVGNARLVGAQMSRMIEVIRNDTGLDLSRFRLIGFSLGAHVVGYAGRNLRRKGIILPRITGLDPAAPYFEGHHVDVRLDHTDAEFVDVMHTDSKTSIFKGFGTTQQMGHIDFYPNGGYNQIGCQTLDIGAAEYLACSHYRAVRYFLESINSQCPFYGYPCATYEDFREKRCMKCHKEGCFRMGYHVKKPNKTSGMKYYLKTHSEFPYCGYHYELKFYTGNKYFADLHGVVTVELFGTNGTEQIVLPRYSYNPGAIQNHVVLVNNNIGDLKKVTLTHNRLVDVWYLVGVSVTQLWSNSQYSACYNRWLNNRDNEVNLVPGLPVTSCSG